jgi:hypothetical protein
VQNVSTFWATRLSFTFIPVDGRSFRMADQLDTTRKLLIRETPSP